MERWVFPYRWVPRPLKCIIKLWRTNKLSLWKHWNGSIRLSSKIWSWTSMSLAPQNYRNLNLGVLYLWCKFGDPSSNVGKVIITVTSWWARWRLKSPASPLFTQPFIQAQINEHIKAPRHWPLCREFPGDRWIPLTNGRKVRKMFLFHDVIKDVPAANPAQSLTNNDVIFNGETACRKLQNEDNYWTSEMGLVVNSQAGWFQLIEAEWIASYGCYRGDRDGNTNLVRSEVLSSPTS